MKDYDTGYYGYDKERDLYDAISKYNKSDKPIYDSTYLLEIIQNAIKEKEKELDPSLSEIKALNEYIDRLKDDIYELKNRVSTAEAETKKTKNKLRIFLKVISKFGLIDKLKLETKRVIQEEKDYLTFSTFFNSNITKLDREEDKVKELDKLFDK